MFVNIATTNTADATSNSSLYAQESGSDRSREAGWTIIYEPAPEPPDEPRGRLTRGPNDGAYGTREPRAPLSKEAPEPEDKPP